MKFRWKFVFIPAAILTLVLSGMPLVISVTPVFGTPQHAPASQNAMPLTRVTPQPTVWNGGVTPQDLMLPVGTIAPNNGSGGPTSPPGDPPGYCGDSFWNGFEAGLTLGILALSCASYENGINDVIGATGGATATDIMLDLGNYQNSTSAMVANVNATAQELTAYFANRAESIVPYFLGKNWSSTISDEIASYSGLAQAAAGITTAIMKQYWQDWNATINSFQNAYGHNGLYCNGCGGLGASNLLNAPYPNPGGNASGIFEEGNQVTADFNLTAPFEAWTAAPAHTYPVLIDSQLYGGAPYYMNLEPGGTIINANAFNQTAATYETFVIHDLTSGHNYTVPQMTYAQFVNVSIPVVSTLDNIAPFDLLEVTCTANCSASTATPLLTSGAYVFPHNTAPAGKYANGGQTFYPVYEDNGNPFLFYNQYAIFGGHPIHDSTPLPSETGGVCIVYNNAAIAGSGICWGFTDPTQGFATQISETGPGQVVGGPAELSQFTPTLNNIVTNAMTLAQSYFDVLNAVTNDSQYAIPPTCSIPFPSAAFPDSTNPANYQLNVNDTTALYIGYLDAVANVFNSRFADGTDFCGNANLAFKVNWNTTFNPNLNVTASIYLGTPAGAINVSGGADSGSVFANPATWPIKNVQPTFLYPYLYQMNVPLDTVYAVPANDPIATLLGDYSGNLFYGTTFTSPNWGIPTYLSLAGYGNFIQISGNTSTRNSGHPLNTGDAVMISSCVLNGIPHNVTCPIAVTYYNNFTFGVIHALIYPTCQQANDCPIPTGGGFGLGGGGGTYCGVSGLNQWYDAWAGYVVAGVATVFVGIGNDVSGIPGIGGGLSAFFDALGCLLGWLVLIIIVVVIAWVALWAFRTLRGR